MNIELLTEHRLEFLSLKGGCTGWSESTRVKMPHCWKSQVTAQLRACTFACNWQHPSWISGRKENDCRNYFMINLKKKWDRTWIKLATPGYAVRHLSAAKQVTNCSMRPDAPSLCHSNSWPWPCINQIIWRYLYTMYMTLFVCFNCLPQQFFSQVRMIFCLLVFNQLKVSCSGTQHSKNVCLNYNQIR